MFRISNITKDWNEAGSFAAQLNLYMGSGTRTASSRSRATWAQY